MQLHAFPLMNVLHFQQPLLTEILRITPLPVFHVFVQQPLVLLCMQTLHLTMSLQYLLCCRGGPQPQRQQAPAPAARRPVAIPQLSRLAAPASGLPRAPGQVGPGPTGPTMGLVAAAWRAPTSTRASRIAGGSCIEGCMPAAGPAAAAGMLADAPARLVSHHPPAQWSR